MSESFKVIATIWLIGWMFTVGFVYETKPSIGVLAMFIWPVIAGDELRESLKPIKEGT